MRALVRTTPMAVLSLVFGCVTLWFCRDCAGARDYIALAWRVNSDSDVPLAFKALGHDVPDTIHSPLDAKIYLAQRAVECRCEENSHAEAFLGSLLVERGELQLGIEHLERGLARSPTSDGYAALATAYELVGDRQASAAARKRAGELRGAWDTETRPSPRK